MKIVSVNIAKPTDIMIGSRVEKTGIYKTSIASGYFGSHGVQHDAVISKKHHGGPDQAVYVYTQPDYEKFLASGILVSSGIFGENLTITDLESADLAVGDRLVLSEVVLEVTSPRIPCATLATRMNDQHFIQKFKDMKAPGFYCRVLSEGEIRAGESFTLTPKQGERVTVKELFDNYYEKAPSRADLERFLRSPLAIRARNENEKKLSRIS